MKIGTFRTSETVKEETPEGTFTYTYTKKIIITEETFYGTPEFYQTERTYRNGQIIFSANYPANTDYARQRRQGIVS